jgi:enoyl-CoA hydratase/carnithine racemase
MVLSIDASAPVVRLDLNRPGEGNSVTTAMMREIVAALRTYGADPATRVIALVARGEMFARGETSVTVHPRIRNARPMSLETRYWQPYSMSTRRWQRAPYRPRPVSKAMR